MMKPNTYQHPQRRFQALRKILAAEMAANPNMTVQQTTVWPEIDRLMRVLASPEAYEAALLRICISESIS
jgi:hypothetical protein